MASSRRTYDTDSITLRTIFAKNQDNTNISALKILTADGAGRCYWGDVSGALGYSAYNEIITSAGTYTADLSFNRFRLYGATGIGMTDGPAGSNQTTLYAKCFTNVDCSGNNNIYAFSNNTLNPSLRLAGQGGILVTSDPGTNTIFITGPANTNYTISTGIYAFSKIYVTPVTSSITSNVTALSGDYITATSPSTLLRLLGNNDIQLSTCVTANSVFFTISTFTSKGYLDMSTTTYTAYPLITSTVSTLYAERSDLTNLALSTGTAFALAGSNIQSNITSSSVGLGTLGYVSSQSLQSSIVNLMKYNFVSSIPFTNTSQMIAPVINPADTTFSIGFSTYQFSLSSFSSYINSNTNILIEQRPNIIFSGVSSFDGIFGMQRFFHTVGLYTNDFTTSFSESTANPFLPFSINPDQSNFFTNSLLMPLKASNVLSNITSTFQTFTILANSILYDNGVNSNTPGLRQSSINLYYPTNSLFLHINNS